MNRITNNSNINDNEIQKRIFFENSNENQLKKRLFRVSSAPKRPYERKYNDASRLDRSSRSISTTFQHRKRKYLLFK
jgi:hypothetical protein